MPSVPDPLAAIRLPFRAPAGVPTVPGEAALAPWLQIRLERSAGGQSLTAEGLLDTGASVNVLPYNLGRALGASWPEQTAKPLQLSGNLAGYNAHPLLLTAEVASFPPVRLTFAWTRAERDPLILGQVNFFLEFDVCFFRSRLLFEIRPKHV